MGPAPVVRDNSIDEQAALEHILIPDQQLADRHIIASFGMMLIVRSVVEEVNARARKVQVPAPRQPGSDSKGANTWD